MTVLTNNNEILPAEYQGAQHYEPINWHGGLTEEEQTKSFSGVQKRDAIKRKAAVSLCIPYLEIPYWQYDNIEQLIRDFVSI